MIKLQELSKIPLKKPANAGGYWQGIQHVQLVETIQEIGKELGYVCELVHLAFSTDKADIVATFTVTGTAWSIPEGYDAILVAKNSNARRWGLSLSIGVQNRADKTILMLGRARCEGRRGAMPWQDMIKESFKLEFPWLMKRAEPFLSSLKQDWPPADWTWILARMGMADVLTWGDVGRVVEKVGVKNHTTGLHLFKCMDHEIATAPECARRDQVEIRLKLTKELFGFD